MKRFLIKMMAVVIAVAAVAGVRVAALADDGGERFPGVYDFDSAGFVDVNDDWSLEGIRTAYEIGLMSGMGGGKFAPKSSVTLAEGAMMAARLHNLWNGGDGRISQDGEKWYSNAVSYCRDHGILAGVEYSDWGAAATRGQLAGMFCHAVPVEALEAINDIDEVVDVGEVTDFHEEILTLYRAGVLTGSDSYGMFHPETAITREEIAAVISRIARPEMRMVTDFQKLPYIYLPEISDLNARFTDRLVMIKGMWMPGVIEAGGELFIPADLLMEAGCLYGVNEPGWIDNNTEFAMTAKEDGGYSVNIDDFTYSYWNPHYVSEITNRPPVARELGVISKAPGYLEVYNNPRAPIEDARGEVGETWRVENALYTLDGEYMLIRVSAFCTGDFIHDVIIIPTLPNREIVYEEDMLDGVMPGVIKDDPRETVEAICQYICDNMKAAGVIDELNIPTSNSVLETGLTNGHTQDEYAAVFCDMCLRAGIPCEFVRGAVTISGAAPSDGTNKYQVFWNRVYIDGQWLYVDCWMKDYGEEKSKEKNLIQYQQNYVLADALTMSVEHFWYGDDYPIGPVYDPAWETMADEDINCQLDFAHCVIGHLARREETFVIELTLPDYDRYYASGAEIAAAALFDIPVISVSEERFVYPIENGWIKYVFTVKYES